MDFNPLVRERLVRNYQRSGAKFVLTATIICLLCLCIRMGYIMIVKADYYGEKAQNLHERERSVKAKRGVLYDRNNKVIAGNESVSTISVIHSQVENEEEVISVLTKELELDEAYVRKQVTKISSREKIKSNIPKETSDRIREYNLAGVMVDEDYKRYYPYDSLASHVIGFTGGDNQGIIGLEAEYDEVLSGKEGAILTLTNARGIEIENAPENRREPVDGKGLKLSLDINIQEYVTQAASIAMERKEAKEVSIIVMNPSNGDIYAMVTVPEFNLNKPFSEAGSDKKLSMDKLNEMWRNPCISNTYEPGSTFKILTAAAALSQGVVRVNDPFFCPGYITVEDRRIRCHKNGGHGSENFRQGIMNSCNPVFITIGARLGTENFYNYLNKFEVLKKTGVDLPGEAVTIMHKKENVGAVELATISFGQSFQLTPLRLMASVSAIINGGHMIVPHFATEIVDEERYKKLEYKASDNIVSEEVSQTMRELLEAVVSEGTGHKAAVEGYLVGGKTGTSEKLPRRSGKYIASCLGFAPADDPKVMALVLIDEPKGIYYGGNIAAPVISELFDNILPYLGIEKADDK